MRALLTGALRILAVAAVAGGSAALVSEVLAGSAPLLRLVAATGTTLAVYALATLLVPRVRADVVAVVEVAKMTRARAA